MSDDEEPVSFGTQYRYGSHRGEPPNACRHCGRPMVITVEFGWPARYDATTGAAIIERHARCSRPWWAALGDHDHAIEDSRHDWAWR